ncbi:MAG: hypothetical protein IIZ64_05670 [Erysipelotrichaceae bacterium]|nr:hypothetical protein [Erysipelotrichaceae bacterium]
MIKDRTKRELAQTLKEMLEKTDFQKIRVSDICMKMGCQRKTFYYHFEDKYQLAAWIYIDTMKKTWDPEKGPYDFTENYIRGMEAIRKDLNFYRKVLPDEALSGVYKHIIRYGDELFSEMITSKGIVLDDELSFMIHYTSMAQICAVREWIFSNPMETSCSLVVRIVASFPEKLRNALL